MPSANVAELSQPLYLRDAAAQLLSPSVGLNR
jgi:hypothetical protein